jgi:ParB family transcriptional regulator, chromosome partitioning protein
MEKNWNKGLIVPSIALQTVEIPIEFLQRGSFQTRSRFAAEELNELALSIKRNGLVQPIVVREISHNKYEIIAGERRWRAAQLAGLQTITCLLRDYTDEQAASVTAVENLNRVDLNPIEEALAYQKLVDDYNYSHDEIAAAVAKSRSKITNSLRLLALPDLAQQGVIDGSLSEGHAKILAGINYNTAQELALRCIREKISVRKLETILKQTTKKALPVDCDLKKLEQNISEKLGVSATIQQSTNSLKLQLECFNVDVLSGVLDRMGVSEDEL